ncbi:MAG: hypothetical protein KGZ58_00265 [Ignavibacteriales bacterium]|nr:hypothetical protein [Ignavibacteriales bacterium]
MPNWNTLLDELQETGGPHDVILRKYLRQLNELTGRNVIVYYSGWLQKPRAYSLEINDNDKTGFMTTVHELDKTKGLDLLLHTPGGDAAATESIVNYLREIFGNDIRAIVPEIAMSAGTMIACACKSILMGKHSSLGPIDPQFYSLPAHGIIEEFKRAMEECSSDPSKIPIWQTIISKYNPTLLGECQKAIDWSVEMVKEWLETGMFTGKADAPQKIAKIIEELGSHALTKSHSRHISAKKCKEFGLEVEYLEDDQKLQEAVLSVHHTCIHTLMSTSASKIIINHNGRAFILNSQ